MQRLGCAAVLSHTALLSIPSHNALHIQRLYHGRIPNKGYREQPPVPDRLKDAMSYFGADTRNVTEDVDPPYIPEEKRQKLAQEVMSSSPHMKNHSRLDRLRAALDRVHNEPPDHEGWREVYLFLRTTEMCCEITTVPGDRFPKGQKLWVELEYCEEKRIPVLMEMPNGMLVLPIFSMEEYMDHYFSRTNAYESCWFPVPRMGTRWEEFCKLPFPVGATGNLHHFSTLATIAFPAGQFGILLNPGQRTSKFITYPEMVHLAKMRKQRSKHVAMSAHEKGASGQPQSPNTAIEEAALEPSLKAGFDTRKMVMKRVEPHEVAERLRGRPALPQIAQLELQLLLYPFEHISHIYIRTVDRPRWRSLLGASEKMTQIDVVSRSGAKPSADFVTQLQRWSFLREFHSDVHIELTREIPLPTATSPVMCVYTADDGAFFRPMATFKGITLAEALGYNDPIVDEKGRKLFDRYSNLFDAPVFSGTAFHERIFAKSGTGFSEIWDEERVTSVPMDAPIFFSDTMSHQNGNEASPSVQTSFTAGSKSVHDIITFLHTIGGLKDTPRTGWVERGVSNPESVSDHMYRMSILCMMCPDTSLDRHKMIKMALCHDAGECLIGDISPQMMVPKEEKKRLEKDAVTTLCGLVSSESGDTIFSAELRDLFLEYEDQVTPESRFVKDMDLLEMIVQAHWYEKTNAGKDLSSFFLSGEKIEHPWARAILESLKATRPFLLQEHGAHSAKAGV